LGVAPIAVCDDTLLTTRDVVPVEPANTASPEYVPVIVSVPAGAAAELHEPEPPDNVAVQSDVEPTANVTDPVGVGCPVTFVVTVAEYVTEVPTVTGLGLAPIDVCDGGGGLFTTSVVVPVEPENWLSPEYVPEIVSVPTGEAEEELHDPLPPDNVAVQSDTEPVENVTDPVGADNPVTVVDTVAE
jgi:hypothetical protein